MGMYTQARGWLNVDSIGGRKYKELSDKLEDAKIKFEVSGIADRHWVSDDTHIHQGSNGSAYIFFGTELKNYDDDSEKWIKYLLGFFPNAEGRIDFQYEEEDFWTNLDEVENDKDDDGVVFSYPSNGSNDGSYSKYWLIRGGSIIKEDTTKTWCYGYGNSYDK